MIEADASACHGRIARRLAMGLVSTLVVLVLLPARQASAAPPSATISDVTVTEGASGSTAVARFVVTLSAPTKKPVGVKYTTQDGTATAGSDYVAVSGTATVRKNATTVRIPVTVNGDDVYEGDEHFTVHLISARGATIADADGLGTIVDDDPVPSVSIRDVSVIEGTGTTTPLSFDVSLVNPSGSDVTVDYASADGSATSPADYGAVSGTLTWPAGTSGTQTVTVDVVADATDEVDETFSITLSNATGGATIGNGSAVAIILDDDAPAPEATATTLRLAKRRTKIIAKGTLTPAHTGLTMTVTLYKRKSGEWVVVATKSPVLGTAVDPDGDGTYSSPYRTTFKRIRGTQKIVARFPGDADHLSSSATVKFKI